MTRTEVHAAKLSEHPDPPLPDQFDTKEADFQRGLAALTQFVAREGHARVPQSHVEPLNGEDCPLGNWVSATRVRYRTDRLSAERVPVLEAIPFWVWEVVYEISMAAELAGMHPQTLRELELDGVLAPTRTVSGNRRYSDTDIALLRRIAELTADGVSLAGAKQILALEAKMTRLEDELDTARAVQPI